MTEQTDNTATEQVFPEDAKHGIRLYEDAEGTLAIETVGDNERIARILLEAFINTQMNSLLIGIMQNIGSVLAPPQAPGKIIT